MLSMTSDFVTSIGCPREDLRLIGEAGYSHVHWCHQWNTDFLYAESEIAQLETWLREFDLQITDVHASAGREKNWGSLREYERLAGVELVINRMEMTARLKSDVIILHMSPELNAEGDIQPAWDQAFRSLDALRQVSQKTGVRIAFENNGFDRLEKIFGAYEPEFVGLCYDCGHGNMIPDGLDRLEKNKDRLISIHIHDNDGEKDLHQPIFMGTVDWERLAGLIASSSYRKWVSMETAIGNSGTEDKVEFLKMCLESGTRFSEMIEEKRNNQTR